MFTNWHVVIDILNNLYIYRHHYYNIKSHNIFTPKAVDNRDMIIALFFVRNYNPLPCKANYVLTGPVKFVLTKFSSKQLGEKQPF